MQHSTDFGCSTNLALGLRPAVLPHPAGGSRCVPRTPYPHDPAVMPPPVCWCLPAADRWRRNAAGCAGGNPQIIRIAYEQRRWYAEACQKNGWSRNVLIHQIESGLYERQVLNSKVSNFKQRLPSPQSELATQTMKDPYVFDFIPFRADMLERDIE